MTTMLIAVLLLTAITAHLARSFRLLARVVEAADAGEPRKRRRRRPRPLHTGRLADFGIRH